MNAPVPVVKMSGAGNDFLVLSRAAFERIDGEPLDWVRRVCRRRLAAGADGVLVVAAAGKDRVHVRFHNPDGSRAFCGNGSRCAARYAYLEGMAARSMVLETDAGEVPAEIDGSEVSLELPAPEDRGERQLSWEGGSVSGRWIVAGVPHFIVTVDDAAKAPLALWGPPVRSHADFRPGGTNFNLLSRRTDGALDLRTWERGVEGETLACGSGAVAAALAARIAGSDSTVRLFPASGIPLTVEIPGDPGQPRLARLRGDARVIFEGAIHPEATCGF